MKVTTTGMVIAWMLVYQMPHAIAADARSNAGPDNQVVDRACAEVPAEAAAKLGFIQQVLAEGKPHAALAHLDAARIKSEQAELLRANALRQTGRVGQAQVIYERLIESCGAGHAYRGLGLIASHAGDLPASLHYLETASRALPADHTIRNDYGYVLMQAGSYEQALHEFLTALELVPDYRQAANNLVLLLYRQEDSARAEAFAKQFGINASEMQQLQKLAQSTRQATP